MGVCGVIYLITCLVTGMKYFGQTTQKLEDRINQHKNGNLYVDRAIQKYGWSKETFKVEVLEECYSREQLNEREKFWIKELNCKYPNGYNLTEGGHGGKFSDVSIAKMSASRTGEKNHFFGKHHTAETCLIISAKNRNESPYKNLLAEMDKRKLSYTSLAKLLGVSIVTLSNKMLTKAKFTERQAAKLETIFNKPVEYLLARDDGLPAITIRAELGARISVAQRSYSPYKNLLAEMDARNLSYAGLAVLLDMSRWNFSERMRGKQNFTERQAAKLETIFNKPIEYLLKRDDGLPAITIRAELGARISAIKRGESLYKNLLAEMDKRHLSYIGLAKLLGLSQASISFKMQGKRKFTAKDKARLEEIFGLSAEYLLERVD